MESRLIEPTAEEASCVFPEIAFPEGLRRFRAVVYLENPETKFAKMGVGLAKYM